MTLKKQGIARAIQVEMDLSLREASLITETILETLKDTLASGEDVLMSGFGKFQVREKAQRRGRNPRTGSAMMLPPRKVVTFRWSGKLRDRLNGG